MKMREMAAVLEQQYPLDQALDWDHVGLQVGDWEKDIQTIYVALDATGQVIQDAVSHHADLLLTHHPLLFHGVQQIARQDFMGERLFTLIQQDLVCYAMHTNYDVLRMADLAAEQLHLVHPEVLEVTQDLPEPKGIGKIGALPEPVSMALFCAQVKDCFSLDAVRLFGDPEAQISRVAVVPGSGSDEIGISIEKKADVLLTGDISHHSGLDAVEQGLQIIDAGHYGLEHLFVADMGAFLRKQFPPVTVLEAPDRPPFVSI